MSVGERVWPRGGELGGGMEMEVEGCGTARQGWSQCCKRDITNKSVLLNLYIAMVGNKYRNKVCLPLYHKSHSYTPTSCGDGVHVVMS